MGAAARTITAMPLDAETWAPFGWLPVADTDADDGAHRLAFTWDDVHVNRIAHRRDEVKPCTGGLRCEELFRHLTHTQVLQPLDAVSVIAVAAPGTPMDSPAGAEAVRAFRLEPLQAVVLHQGTWHWGPFPVTAASVELLNVQGLRYREDNERADIAAIGAPVDVLVS